MFGQWIVNLSPYSKFSGRVGLVVGTARGGKCLRVQAGSSGPFYITAKYRQATEAEVAKALGHRVF
jgi:hypothetical protein